MKTAVLSFTLMALGFVSACSSSSSTPSETGGGGTGGSGNDASPGDGSAGTTSDAATEGDGPGAGLIVHANPIVSRSAQVFSSPAGASGVVNDGNYHNGGWTVPKTMLPAWVAFKLAAGPTRVLVSWDDGGTYNYQDLPGTTVYGFPSAYQIDVSSDSTNGSDGTWTTKVTVGDTADTLNHVRTRAHSFDFTGQTWVKMTITAVPAEESTNGLQIGEIDIHDISAAGAGLPDDTWFLMGDSITAFAFDRASAHQPSFAKAINTAAPSFYPAMINGGIGGETSAGALARLQQVLDVNPDYRFITLNYGTNDVSVAPSTFKSNMQSMIDMVKAAGRIPVIPHIPYSGDGNHNSLPQYNTVIDQLVATNQLIAGPDLYAHFMANQTEFVCPPCGGARMTDNLHPNDVGLEAMNTLWASAMRSLYP
jgi:acyl-CoA thioesterase-1